MVNIDNNLILIKGVDKTADIDRWDYQTGYILVTFLRGGKTYRYNISNVEFYKDPEELSLQNFRILKNGQSLPNIVRIQKFDRHVRVFYKSGNNETFHQNSVAIMPSSLNDPAANDLFSYFKELAHIDTLLGTDGSPILGKRFDKIDFVREDSVLSNYLKGKLSQNQQANTATLLYPFGFNASQKQAVDNALNYKLSMIEGPPGTGKTQTILNIIANAVMRGESVAVVSSNNSAIENVEEKLKKYDVDFISAFLGSTHNKEAFILKQKKIPQLNAWKLTPEEKTDINHTLSKLHITLESMLSKKNQLAKLRLELDATKLEEQHFMAYYTQTNDAALPVKSLWRLNSIDWLKLMAQAELVQETGNTFSFFSKIFNFLRFSIYNFSFYNTSAQQIVAVCQKRYYKAKNEELTSQIAIIEKELHNFDFNAKMNEYSDFSMKLFRQKLAQKYENQARQSYTEQDLWKHSESFIKDYPVILSTTHSLRSSLNSQFVYDYVIIDEASQVSVTTGALAFSCAKKAVVVGDLMQLSNVVDNEMKKRTDAIWNAYNIPEAYQYATRSLLLSVTELFAEVPKVMLQEHYRCSPKIINFCNQKFYNNQLIILTEDKEDIAPLVAYQTVPGNHAREHINQRQIDVIKNEVIPQQHLCVSKPCVGIVTPYRNQANALQMQFAQTAVQADTVDKFQGQERDVIILSTVDNDISDFADDDHRLNVAISRAIKQLIVVISGNAPTRQTGIGDLVKYIRYNNMEVINSEVYSVFDLLYKQYATIRRQKLSKKKRVSGFDSENLMFDLICEVLHEPAFCKYDVLLHIPLRMILRDLSKLVNDRAIGFVMNENTHVDFLIYDKLSHQPVLVVEVDGVRFHREGSVQAGRDSLKDCILAQYGIPIVRFRTNESNEKVRLKAELERIAR